MKKDSNFLGRGWKFPPAFDKKSGETVVSSNEVDVMEALEILIGTQKGERVMNPNYGSSLGRMVFSATTPAITTLIENTLKESLIEFEPRIIVHDVKLDASGIIDGRIVINVDYSIRSTNNRKNIVYPFYLSQGTLIPERLMGQKIK